MKKICVILCLATSSAWAQPNVPDIQPEWKVTVRIVGEDGFPIEKAHVGVGYYFNLSPTNIDGITDTNGIFVASAKGGGLISFRADKTGYYPTSGTPLNFESFTNNQWVPRNPSSTLLIKKIGKQTPMYAKQIDSLIFPEFNKSIGYDLMIGDWIAPYGKGINSDFLFTEHHGDAQSGYTYTVSFPHIGDGIQESTPDKTYGFSGLRSLKEAPFEGYLPVREQKEMPNQKKVFYFRVRTVRDSDGNIVSAHYGKIYGDFMQFTYYLNPTPNDRNIEFDPSQNLIHGLQAFEQARQP